MPPLPRDLGPATPVDLARTSEADLRAAARALPPGGHLLVTLGPGRARRDAARLRATGLVLMPEHPAPGIRVACRPLELGDAALDHAPCGPLSPTEAW